MSDSKKTGLSDNMVGAVAYFTPFMAIFFLAIRRYNKRPYVRFHAWQSLVFNVFAISLGYLLAYTLPLMTFLGSRALIVIACLAVSFGFLVWLWCVVNAANGKRYRLPVIGDWADEQAYR